MSCDTMRFYCLCYFSWILIRYGFTHPLEYDYIVVGCGSAGSAVANRLSEDPKSSVLLLEAGEEPNLLSDVPLLPLKLSRKISWDYRMESQKHSFFGYDQHAPRWLTGKVLGGTSVLNYNLYVRGNPRDFDSWAKKGAIGWSWKDVLGYFIKSEDNTNKELLLNGYHGAKGPVTVAHSPFYSPVLKNFLASVLEMGYEIGDFNTDKQDQFFPTQGTIREGKRLSSYSAFIKPILCRKNFRLITSAFVTKILLDEFKQAKGVAYEKDNVTKIAYARKEVIISAGAVNTPKLLMLSGIGPKEHLSDLGIPVIADLPVGQNFHDHIGRPMIFTIEKPYSFHQLTLNQFDYTLYLDSGKGRLTSLGGAEVIGFINTKYEKKNWPDVQIVLLANSVLSDAGLALLFPGGHLSKDVFLKAFAKYKLKHTITCNPILLRPKSRGCVLLKSKNPHDEPRINPNYLSKIEDVLALIEGMKTCMAFGETSALKKLGIKLLQSEYPRCDHYPVESDEYLACILRVFSLALYHGAGTCKMGSPTDPSTVVDAKLRVKGIPNLRVADCSVMPSIISGNPHATAIMIGEKAADIIRFDSLGKDLTFQYF
ncbi:uncharacterized GMC-type oxidoreductase Mb1310-like [Centruroides vittatus]|uniref:uncharacterized GMC-type oxidoreductase Mb1310-like n=1 Tax=Centruroides vittatus TaxID=120091 RepID=UPI00350FD4BF